MKNPSGGVRPTTGRVMGALFSILTSSGHLPGARFLDLFAGSGAISLEAIRRGASSVVAVESDRRRADAISRALSGERDRARVVCADVRRSLPRLGEFDVVFADPPYCEGWGVELPALISASSGLIASGGVFVFERSSREEAAPLATPWDDRRYGETVLSFCWH